MSAVSYSSIEASIIATLITQPIWVIKTRMLLNIQPNIGEIENAILKIKVLPKVLESASCSLLMELCKCISTKDRNNCIASSPYRNQDGPRKHFFAARFPS